MIWILLLCLLQLGLIVFLFLEVKKISTIKKVFDELLITFVNSNQTFYENQKQITKQYSSNLDQFFKYVKELHSIKTSSIEIKNLLPTISNTAKNVNEMTSLLKDINKFETLLKSLKELIVKLNLVVKQK